MTHKVTVYEISLSRRTLKIYTLEFLSELLNVVRNSIERVHVFKLLGVLLDDNLKWNNHVDAVCARASSRLHFLTVRADI